MKLIESEHVRNDEVDGRLMRSEDGDVIYLHAGKWPLHHGKFAQVLVHDGPARVPTFTRADTLKFVQGRKARGEE